MLSRRAIIYATERQRNVMTDSEKVKEFVRAAFQRNPSYSFNDPKIMFNHSVLVEKYAARLAKEVACDAEAVSIAALLHDVGKTFDADEKTLYEKHGELAWTVSAEFVNGLELPEKTRALIERLLCGDYSSVEGRIVKDADVIAFYADEELQDAFCEWALKQGQPDELTRKLEKYEKLGYPQSKELAKPLQEKLKAR